MTRPVRGERTDALISQPVDTDMMAGYEGPKVDPAEVVRAALDGVEAGKLEVVVDEWSASIKASLARDPIEFYGQSLSS